MKKLNCKQATFFLLCALFISFSLTSCSKTGSGPGVPGIRDYGTHSIDPQLQGQWMWTSGSAGGYYDDNGTWLGGQYGFAYRMAIDEKGNGTLYSHIYSDLGPGSYLAVDIYYTGYYEMDDAGNLTFYSMGGRYTNSDGVNRALEGNEIYNPSSGSGRTVSFPAIEFTTLGEREAFTTTYEGQTDAFYRQ